MTVDEVHVRWWLRARDAYLEERYGEALACIERYRARDATLAVAIDLHLGILIELHRLDDAWTLIEPRLAATKQHYVATNLIAMYFDAREDRVCAEDWYRRLAALVPTQTAGAILLGAFHARRGQLDQAEATHRHAATLAGDVDEALLNLGLVLRSQGRLAEAREVLRRSAAMEPLPAAHALADLERATALAELDLDPVDGYDRAFDAWTHGWITEALVCIEHHRHREPDEAVGLVIHGEILTTLRRFDEARALLDRAAESLSPDADVVFWAMARHLETRGDLDAADAWYARRCDDTPGATRAWVGRGDVYQRQGRLAQAEAAYRRATMLDGDRNVAWFQLGLVLRSQGRFADAVEAFARVLALDPVYPGAAAARADAEAAARIVASPEN